MPRPKYKQSIGDVALRRVFGATWAVFPCSNSLTLVANVIDARHFEREAI